MELFVTPGIAWVGETLDTVDHLVSCNTCKVVISQWSVTEKTINLKSFNLGEKKTHTNKRILQALNAKSYGMVLR